MVSNLVTTFQVRPAGKVGGAAFGVSWGPEYVCVRGLIRPDNVVKEIGGRGPWVFRRVKGVMTGAFAVGVYGKLGCGVRDPDSALDEAGQSQCQ